MTGLLQRGRPLGHTGLCFGLPVFVPSSTAALTHSVGIEGADEINRRQLS